MTIEHICASLRPLGGQAFSGRIATVKPVASIQWFSMLISAMKGGAAYPTEPETETNWFQSTLIWPIATRSVNNNVDQKSTTTSFKKPASV
jgi:hypothetical protein